MIAPPATTNPLPESSLTCVTSQGENQTPRWAWLTSRTTDRSIRTGGVTGAGLEERPAARTAGRDVRIRTIAAERRMVAGAYRGPPRRVKVAVRRPGACPSIRPGRAHGACGLQARSEEESD